MSRFIRLVLVATLFCGAWGTTASAQLPAPVGPTPSPTLSPYLNLIRSGAPAAINYYGIIRPQIATRNALGNLQQQVLMNQRQIGTVATEEAAIGLPTTGTPAYFLNTGGYFLNNQVGSGPGGTMMFGSGQPAIGVNPRGGQMGVTGSRTTTLPYRR